ncbi:hypothetical protein [Domibacillus robiginosus]|uniref:hypothetical protein n=1 Tax=Domibacillus robiginosus TaxID=1071054 RepID=UPI00067DB514|nr:hypothetical protein [Domibacillus robiginosus]
MNIIAWLIIACEIAFWVVILTGLMMRYVFRQEKAGLIFLALTPVIDLLLLIFTVMDLYRGASATIAHGIAAVYIGVSIAYGRSMVHWADKKFRQYLLKDGSRTESKTGLAFARQDAKNAVRHAFAYAIGAGLLYAIILFIGEGERTEALWQILRIWTIVLAIDLLITVSYFIWPKQAKKNALK